MVGGYSGPGLKAIVPGRAELKLSCRLVPNQRPERIAQRLKARVRRLNPDVQVAFEGGALPFLGEVSPQMYMPGAPVTTSSPSIATE